jgi:hypothetical protein
MSDMNSNDAALAPGTRLNGIFEIERHIVSGGMGEIYRGPQAASNRTQSVAPPPPAQAECPALPP